MSINPSDCDGVTDLDLSKLIHCRASDFDDGKWSAIFRGDVQLTQWCLSDTKAWSRYNSGNLLKSES
jgi:hypothetical protein